MYLLYTAATFATVALLIRLCPPKVLLADKNAQNWLKTAFNPQTP